MILETVCVGQMQVNCYILAARDNSGAVIIDPGDDARKIKRILEKHKLNPAFIINTHGHYDHIGADDEFGVPVYVHAKDSPLLKNPELNLSSFFLSAYSVKERIIELEDKKTVEFGELQLEVIHTPGHTPGGICLLMKKPENKILFTGDTLFYRGIGRADFRGADEASLIKSIKERLLTLADDTVIYPGHGPSSTIGDERRKNPFLNE
ncbi:MAG: MBL fold metallo-hydrolase [Candidatus Omnitrophica bacterium]|nr:MBL fold metallo-hydrolase [Candidatus Omnitrophota bacterium]MDD5237793.1 MBL fold metallo-hydrolase [Candidatus Omnitrophota bacterium]